MKTKYLLLLLTFLGFMACENDDDSSSNDGATPLPELTAGTADFSTYVALGNSLTAGFTDGALFMASQENSFPNLLSQKFSMLGGGEFTQPLMNDNFGGLLLAGNPILNPETGNRIYTPRLVFDGAGPVPLQSVNPNAESTTDIAVNNPSGPFNNMAVPGALSFHLLAPGYGNISNLPLANPYFVRMTGSTPDASIMDLAMAQSPSFVTLWIGANDVLGYATGGAADDSLTPQASFDATLNSIMASLGDVQGAMANLPYVTDIPFFTTVPHNPLDPSDETYGPLIPTLNSLFGALNQVYSFLGVPERAVIFSESEASAVVIRDESIPDLGTEITQVLLADPNFPAFIAQFGLPPEAAPLVATLLGSTYGQTRQATENDLLPLTSASVIGTINEAFFGFLTSQGLSPEVAGQFSVEGITFPLADKWSLIPSEQNEIRGAIDGYNASIQAAANGAGFAFVDANTVFQEMASVGFMEGNYTFTSDLVFGGAVSLDGVHPTSRGYALSANLFLRAIDETYGSNFEASGNLLNMEDYPTNYSPFLE